MGRWLGKCRDCQEIEHSVKDREWTSASKPRCSSCGGMLDKRSWKGYTPKTKKRKKPRFKARKKSQTPSLHKDIARKQKRLNIMCGQMGKDFAFHMGLPD